MSNVFPTMGLTSSKPFQISLSDIIVKVRCYSACFGGQVIVEGHCQFEESNNKRFINNNGTLTPYLYRHWYTLTT